MLIKNIFDPTQTPHPQEELFETLSEGSSTKVERIISRGQVTAPGKWYDSDTNEWVVLIQGKATLELEGGKLIHLSAGDYVVIPAHQKHRVSYTSTQPWCLWIAVHFPD